MAIIGITPTFMSPMAFRDSAQELAQQSREGAAALQNAFKFGTQVYDYAKNRQIGNALKKGDVDKAALLESQKINQQDPSVLWRWNKGQQMQQAQIDEAKAQREADKQDMQNSIFNKTKATRGTPVDESNPDAILHQINNLNGHIAEMENAKMDPAVIADVQKERDAWIGKLNTANEAVKANLTRNKTVSDIKEQINAGAIGSAMNMIADAIGNDTISQDQADQFQALIAAKEQDLANQARTNITAQQSFADAQEKRRKEKARKRTY